MLKDVKSLDRNEGSENLTGIDPDLYCFLPPDKKEEYRKMFPEPVYLKIYRAEQGYMWIDQELLEIPESWIPPLNIINNERLPSGTLFCDYVNVHEDKKLIHIRYKNI